ncbi:iron ABC transporter permease [Yangia mangrovi]|uniref:Iron ABC transporter permease n=1 Tax=Alloyangia mangrovi TaxID=1779329 RepID=A0ABT2KQ28_9RHOB|nr:iron ABC transporter permease [Alloyangia mangrovi]MCT4372242.1 iron ABC transporter permease [Alloyangia mangrovi]
MKHQRTAGFAALGCALALIVALSLMQGAQDIAPARLWQTLLAADGSREHIVLTGIRLPRALTGLLAGAALAVAGAILQAASGNPLASPGLLGVNAGAAFSVVFAISILGVSEPGLTLWFAFAGAATAAAAVYGLGQSAGGTTQTLLLAGAVAGGFLTALTTVVLIYDQNALDQVRLWTAGSLSGRRMTDVAAIAPFLLAALAAALLLRRQIMVLSLGRDVAHGLGQNRRLWLAIALILSVLLSGGAVALAGPVSFVGLVAPHLVRLVAGADYRVLLPAAALTGPVLLLGADTAGHWLSASAAFPVGISTALLGAPFFIWLARRGTGGAR